MNSKYDEFENDFEKLCNKYQHEDFDRKEIEWVMANVLDRFCE